MKALMVVAALALFASSVSANNWEKNTEKALVGGFTAVLAKTSEGPMIGFKVPDAACRGMTLNMTPAPAVDVNGVKVKMNSGCIEGKHKLWMAATLKGEAYIVRQFMKKDDVSFAGGSIVFSTNGFNAALKGLATEDEGI